MSIEGLDWITDGVSLVDAFVLFMLAYVIWEWIILGALRGIVRAISDGWHGGKEEVRKERLRRLQRADGFKHSIEHYDRHREEG